MEFGIDYPISMALLKVIMGDHGGETVWEHDVRNAHAGLGSLRPASRFPLAGGASHSYEAK